MNKNKKLYEESENLSDTENIKDKNSDDELEIKDKKKNIDDDDYDDDYDKEDKEEYEEKHDEYKEKDDEVDEIDEEDECIYDEINIQNKDKSKKVNDEDRITINKLTKYERAKIICARA